MVRSTPNCDRDLGSAVGRQFSRYFELETKILRQGTVPTIVGAHTFCAHGRHGLHQARAIVDLDVINYATKYTTEIVESTISLL